MLISTQKSVAPASSLALVSPAMAQQSGAHTGRRRRQPRTDVEPAIPLTPGMIRDLGRRVGDNKRAEEEVNTEIASPISRRVNVSFAPGQSTSIIRIVKGYPTALSFFDRTGQPWPIEWDTNSNPAGQANNGNCNRVRRVASGPAVASAGLLCLHADGRIERPAGRGGVVAAARRAPCHAQGRAEADLLHAGRGRGSLRCRYHGAGRGARPERQGRGDRSGCARHGFAVPDRDARWRAARRGRALGGRGVSPDDLRAWKVGNRVVLRTRFALISPEWLASETGEGGVTVYSLPVTPIVLLSQDGRTISASLSEPRHT